MRSSSTLLVEKLSKGRRGVISQTMIMKDLTERDSQDLRYYRRGNRSAPQLGCGFLEPVYQEALAVEFSKREIPFHREVTLPVFYKKSD